MSRKQVRFDNKTKVVLVEHLDDCTDKEISSIWYTPEEQRLGQQSIIDSISKMRQQANEPASPECSEEFETRGLEHFASPAQAIMLKRKQKSVINAVLNQQDYQWDVLRKINPIETLSRISQMASQEAVNRAITIGAADAAYVRRLRLENKPSSTKSFPALQEEGVVSSQGQDSSGELQQDISGRSRSASND